MLLHGNWVASYPIWWASLCWSIRLPLVLIHLKELGNWKNQGSLLFGPASSWGGSSCQKTATTCKLVYHKCNATNLSWCMVSARLFLQLLDTGSPSSYSHGGKWYQALGAQQGTCTKHLVLKTQWYNGMYLLNKQPFLSHKTAYLHKQQSKQFDFFIQTTEVSGVWPINHSYPLRLSSS